MGLSSSIFNLSIPYILVVYEKPTAAQRISCAVGTFNVKKVSSTEIAGDNKIRWTLSPFFSAMDKKGSALCYMFCIKPFVWIS